MREESDKNSCIAEVAFSYQFHFNILDILLEMITKVINRDLDKVILHHD